jgi:GAF domain-containing protein/anti-sigma regulatory factor (Ser/Thr protein kinase)
VLANQVDFQGESAVQLNLIRTDLFEKSEERRRLQEAEAMRDVMTALAMAADMNQTLEIILVNLRNVIGYDRAGLFLLDENMRYVLAGDIRPGQGRPLVSRMSSDPVIVELQDLRRPLVKKDIQNDKRFSDWPDMGPVHGWIGAPLIVGEKVIGFLSIGSLQVGAFDDEDADIIQAFTSQVSAVLERAWTQEKYHRRTEELEVLSAFSLALGQVESRENILSTIADQITNFFDARRGVILFPDAKGTALVVKFSMDESVLDLQYPRGDDLLWQVFDNGHTAVVRDLTTYSRQESAGFYQTLFPEMRSVVIIPLKMGQMTSGVLCFSFEESRDFSEQDLDLYDAIAEIAGGSLQRAVVLEALENQVDVRTQHLSTLYSINSFAGEPLELEIILDQVLQISLSALNQQLGVLYLINPDRTTLNLLAEHNLPQEISRDLQSVPTDERVWDELLNATEPLILNKPLHDHTEPGIIHKLRSVGDGSILAAPIRAEGEALGLLIGFDEKSRDISQEEITLVATIGDQIGAFVERDRLIRKAERAAVVEERQRLARELHDSVTQLLYSQVLFAGAGQKVLNKEDSDLTRQYLSRIEDQAQQALKEMRLLVFELRPSEHLEEGLVVAIKHRLDAVEKRSGMHTSLNLEGKLDLNEAEEIGLYRITQEALNNTLKHAGASQVSIKIQQNQEHLVLEICDDGYGFDLHERATQGGMGLTNMLERASALGGKLEIDSEAGVGTSVRVIIRSET